MEPFTVKKKSNRYRIESHIKVPKIIRFWFEDHKVMAELACGCTVCLYEVKKRHQCYPCSCKATIAVKEDFREVPVPWATEKVQ